MRHKIKKKEKVQYRRWVDHVMVACPCNRDCTARELHPKLDLDRSTRPEQPGQHRENISRGVTVNSGSW